jgi:hypothetical protein
LAFKSKHFWALKESFGFQKEVLGFKRKSRPSKVRLLFLGASVDAGEGQLVKDVVVAAILKQIQ